MRKGYGLNHSHFADVPELVHRPSRAVAADRILRVGTILKGANRVVVPFGAAA